MNNTLTTIEFQGLILAAIIMAILTNYIQLSSGTAGALGVAFGWNGVRLASIITDIFFHFKNSKKGKI